jgi:uncharacterized protein involved in exopolysaccharide biosynthesis
MSKKGVISIIVVCLLLAIAGASVLGWMYLTKDQVAVTTYKVQVPPGARMTDFISKEDEMMKSDAVLKPVVAKLDLVARWKLASEEEALARIRSKLIVEYYVQGDRVRVMYRDRGQDRALEVLESINEEFAKIRYEATMKKTMLPVVPAETVP